MNDMSNIMDKFISGRREHKDGRSWMICRTLWTNLSLEDTNIKTEGHEWYVEHYGQIYLWKTQTQRRKVMNDMSNIMDKFISGKREHEEQWS